MELTEFQRRYPSIASQTRWKVMSIQPWCQHCKLEIEEVVFCDYELGDKFQGWQPFAVNSNGERVFFTIDHIIPRSRNGPNEIRNYQCLCQPCNLKKGNDPEYEHYIIQPDDQPADYVAQIASRRYKNITEHYPEWRPYYGF